MTEWKPLVGYEDDYEVSNEGSVRRSTSRGKFHQRFTPEQIDAVKANYSNGQSQRKIAALFGVSQMTIQKIVAGISYVDANHVLVPARRTDGYWFVTLSVKGKHTHKALHTAVAETFLGGRPHNAWINHKNGDKSNNRVKNLEYMTPAGNMQHALYELGKSKKLTFNQAKDIWYAKQKGEKRKEVAARHGISIHMVTAIWMGKSWWHAR
jgi:DNA-binding MarR family transcriptional regulator